MDKARSIVKGRPLVYVAPSTTVADAAGMMSRAKIGAVVVLDEGKLAGIFTERDLLNRVVVPCRDTQKTTMAEVMTEKVVVAGADESYEQCLEKMKKVGCRHLPIVDKDQLIGIVSIRDLLMHDISVKDAEIKMMNYLYFYQPYVLEE